MFKRSYRNETARAENADCHSVPALIVCAFSVGHRLEQVWGASSMDPSSSTHQHKKKRVSVSVGNADELPPDVGVRPVQLQRRRVWRACESCRYALFCTACSRQTETGKTDARRSSATGVSRRAASAKRRTLSASGCRRRIVLPSADSALPKSLPTLQTTQLGCSYVQELEARLLHMESLFTQIRPVLDQVGANIPDTPLSAGFDPTHGYAAPMPTISRASAQTAASVLQSLRDKDDAGVVAPPADNRSTPDSSASVKIEDDVADSLGQLALDEHGHMRWIGGSSTMSLINSFKQATAAPQYRVSPVVEDTSTPNRLYFPAAVFFGKVRALPGPEEVEYPPRDLADKLVRAFLVFC